MGIKTGISFFGWFIYLIFASLILKYVIESYQTTSELEWVPLACLLCFGIVGAAFQFIPSRGHGVDLGGRNTVIPPNDSSGSDGGF
ncbi:hypothetical protein MED92_11599 [Oceanospirillum sp. MED92]|uniref:Uncharacterized protein n=1 Tax=Neptuniibacter caesariensis TaxID=207954 RepID=A0A7U8C334_NEPCE|nr:hypothetical protein MED92_11599 [Oceanospirillum sp. MED92] [Neptuniibacter caesariensis]